MHAPETTRLSKTRVDLVAADYYAMTTVPYSTPGDPSRCFVDVRVNPQLIDRIREPDGRADLREQVELLNESSSPFSSIGCERAESRMLPRSGRP